MRKFPVVVFLAIGCDPNSPYDHSTPLGMGQLIRKGVAVQVIPLVALQQLPVHGKRAVVQLPIALVHVHDGQAVPEHSIVCHDRRNPQAEHILEELLCVSSPQNMQITEKYKISKLFFPCRNTLPKEF